MEKKEALAALSALSQETRLDVFRLLIQAGPDGCAAGAIAEALCVSPTTLSFHLAQLTHAGLILQRREGRSLIYGADFERMNRLVAFLVENCCGEAAGAAVFTPICTKSPGAYAGRRRPARAAVPVPPRDV